VLSFANLSNFQNMKEKPREYITDQGHSATSKLDRSVEKNQSLGHRIYKSDNPTTDASLFVDDDHTSRRRCLPISICIACLCIGHDQFSVYSGCTTIYEGAWILWTWRNAFQNRTRCCWHHCRTTYLSRFLSGGTQLRWSIWLYWPLDGVISVKYTAITSACLQFIFLRNATQRRFARS